MSGNKILLCDIDNTFYEYETPNKRAQEAVVASLATILNATPEVVKQALEKGRERTHHDLHGQSASHARGIYYHHALEQLTGRSQPALVLHHEKLFWNTFLDNMQLYEGVEPYVQELLQDGWRLGIITNLTQAIQFEKLDRLGMAQHFEFVVTSEEAGVEKPDARIFTHLMRKFVPSGLIDPAIFYMIGDSEEADVEGARNAGIPDSNIFLKKKEGEVRSKETGITEFSDFNDLRKKILE